MDRLECFANEEIIRGNCGDSAARSRWNASWKLAAGMFGMIITLAKEIPKPSEK